MFNGVGRQEGIHFVEDLPGPSTEGYINFIPGMFQSLYMLL